jgi:hypothetical protein
VAADVGLGGFVTYTGSLDEDVLPNPDVALLFVFMKPEIDDL